MNLASFTRKIRPGERTILLAAAFCVMNLAAGAENAPAGAAALPNFDAWRVWLEPKFMRPAVAEPVTGAKMTEVAAGQLQPEGLVAFRAPEFAALGIERALFTRLASLNAAQDLPKLRYRFERNARRIIRYARVESDEPIVASVVLCPGFLDLWKNTLGEKVLLVVPNRYTAYLFPRIASEYLEYSPMIFRDYRETAYPVSVEVFELSAEGWRCMGAYEEP